MTMIPMLVQTVRSHSVTRDLVDLVKVYPGIPFALRAQIINQYKRKVRRAR